MEQTYPLYLMLSRTNTSIGKTIRFFTNYEYNHVSLSLDPKLRHWVSFARYTKDVPLAGGFVTESPQRFFDNTASLPVRIFEIPISAERFRELEKLFTLAGQKDSGLIYNTFGAVAAGLGFHFPVAASYTCLEFADEVLGEYHTSIAQLDEDHAQHLIYEGDLRNLLNPDAENPECQYFQPIGFCHAASRTVWHFGRLFCRAVLFRNRYDAVAAMKS